MDLQKELIAEFEQETASTRKLLEALPADVDFSFKPHEKSMSLGRLVGHILETNGEWASCVLTKSGMFLPADHKWEPYVAASKSELLAKFDSQVASARQDLHAFLPAQWELHWKFVWGEQTFIDETKYNVWRTWVLNHLIHHRAQLGVYLRLLGARLPGIYGPSADDQS